MVIFDEFRRSLRGNVDRNCKQTDAVSGFRIVVPYVGTWIEMSQEWIEEDKSIGRSLRGNVDRNTL